MEILDAVPLIKVNGEIRALGHQASGIYYGSVGPLSDALDVFATQIADTASLDKRNRQRLDNIVAWMQSNIGYPIRLSECLLDDASLAAAFMLLENNYELASSQIYFFPEIQQAN